MGSGFAGTILAFSSAAAFPEVQRCMKNPGDFPKAMLSSIVGILICYLVVIIPTYLAIGSEALLDPANGGACIFFNETGAEVIFLLSCACCSCVCVKCVCA